MGEGTGRSRDLDAWDSWYEHIVLWDDAAMRIAHEFPWSRFGSIEVRPVRDMQAVRDRVGAA